MTKEKRRMLFVIVLFTLVLVCSAYSALIPSVQAAELTASQKGLVVSSDVVGLDLTKYVVNTKEYPQDTYLGILPQENVRYELNSNESRLSMLYTFINGKLQMIHVLEREGLPSMTKSAASKVELAQDFLANYQDYSGNLVYSKLKSSLANVDSDKNSSKTVEDTKLEVSINRDYLKERITFRWTYIFDGVEAPDKVVALTYENGFLELFLDNWNIYQIGSTSMSISEGAAIDIAMTRASNYSWEAKVDNATYEITNFNITKGKVIETVFRTSLVADKGRSDDPLLLYPMRHVWISLDKFYPPGNIYGINVYVWADTGEVARIQPRFTTVEPPSELVATIDDVTSNQTTPEAKSSSSQIDWGALSAFAALTIGIAPIWLFRKRNLLVRRFFKIAAVLLCLLPVSLVLFPIASVCATYPYSRATIWGSESIGAWDDRLGYQVSWRKAPWEVSQQQSTAINIADRFDFNGYNADNYQGSHGQGSMKYAILDQIWINEANYPRVAVVDFDHGNGNAGINGIPEFPGIPEDEFHYMFEDNFGVHDGTPENPGPVLHSHAVYDMEIYNKTAFNKTFFAFMNTCNSAHVDDWYNGQYPSGQGIIPGTSRARGMPFAWTHRSVGQIGPGFNTNQNMSDDGYNNADGGNFVYIGFVGGSASLSQTLSGSWPYYHTWLEQFFGYALIYDMSVKDALDHASYSLWPGYCFDQTPLRAGNGFWAIWEVWNPSEGWHNLMGGSWGKMAVYGNGNIRLYQYQLTVNALDQYGSAVPGVEVYMDGVTLGQAGNSWKIVPTSHQLQVSVPIGYTFQYFEGYPSGQNPITVQLNSDYMTVTARYYITPVSLTIQNNYGLYYTVPAVGTHWYNYGTDVQVWAYPLSHWVFTHWHLDGSDYTTMNPCWVNMYDDHVLRPIFQYSP